MGMPHPHPSLSSLLLSTSKQISIILLSVVRIGFGSDKLKTWCEFFWPITGQRNAKPYETQFAFDVKTPLSVTNCAVRLLFTYVPYVHVSLNTISSPVSFLQKSDLGKSIVIYSLYTDFSFLALVSVHIYLESVSVMAAIADIFQPFVRLTLNVWVWQKQHFSRIIE